MAIALVVATRKLRPYFQAHTVEVYTECPLKLILQKPELSRRLTKWAIELSEFDIKYTPKTSLKGQAVADFIVEFTKLDMEVRKMMKEKTGEDISVEVACRWLVKYPWQRGRRSKRGQAVGWRPSRGSCTGKDSRKHYREKEEEAEKILKDIYSNVCENHTRGKSLAHKWQWTSSPNGLKQKLLCTSLRQTPLILSRRTYFISSGIPSTIIIDNDTQFGNKKFKKLCKDYKISNYYASPAHSQTNGQTEAVNKVIKHTSKAKLDSKKGIWGDKLHEVLWAY
ncbi:hypothetical protein Q3G72_032118 [Acer saccharum]|nr:hypothetical protein Q3G72_032118 [Acer saccharum]